MSEPVKWADKAMYHGERHETYEEETGVMPKVRLLWMNEDPLGCIAAMTSMYQGRVVRGLSELTREDRLKAWEDATATHLAAPLEAVKFQFMIDGVDRAFTHQMVRQRTANFAQESMRFAVIEDLPHRITMPPSAMGSGQQATKWRERFMQHARLTGDLYDQFIAEGMAAEDARALLPHNTATRIFYDTNLRNLADHAGNRLCTQAQFHWRLVFHQIVTAIANYVPARVGPVDRWQHRAIAESHLFRPVCYRQNKCPFNASFDRGCKIKSRVEAFADEAIASESWHLEETARLLGIAPIDHSEWLMDPAAARKVI